MQTMESRAQFSWEVAIVTHINVVSTSPRPMRNALMSWLAVVAVPVLLVGGFVLGSLLIGDPNAVDAPRGWDGAWRVLLLWAGLEIVPTLGIWLGTRGVRRQEPNARGARLANILVFLFFVGVTLIGGMSDALN